MAVSVVMPALEMAQDAGKLIAWRKREGERVRKGEALLEIETDKAVVEVEAPGDGILAAVSAQAGAVVPVGQTIAWLVQPGEAPPVAARTPAIGPIRISPKARRLAREHGLDPASIPGSGPAGEILADDVLGASRSGGEKPTVALSAIARLMAERTTHSWTTVPHFFVSRDADATAMRAARARMSGISETDLLVSRVARTLAKHPRLNASWIDGAIRTNGAVNVAIAIAVEDGVVAGVIERADALPIQGIAARRRELVARARAGRLQPADIAGATFTVSNLGMHQVDAFTAVIVPPQAGILAVGAIADRVVAVDGRPVVRPMLTLMLSCDHRVVDGVRAAAFLADLVAVIAAEADEMEGTD
jgi:pyruvate dehydrogenase E2 component (dihydrolipoyllysine-residue acetyltransferase)